MNFTRLLQVAVVLLLPFLSLSQNVGINSTGTPPDPTAALDVDANNKGLLVPRVPLTSRLDIVTIPGPTTSLLVYNTATSGLAPNDVTPGYYYWDGSEWLRFVTATQNSYVLDDIESIVAANQVTVLGTSFSTINNVNLGMQVTVTVPPNKDALVVIEYSVPMGIPDFQDLNGYYGIRFLKNGIEQPSGSRKSSAITGGTGARMNTISGVFTEEIPASGATQTITYTLNGYIENLGSISRNVRFNMWQPVGNNFNWGRSSMVKTVYLKDI